MDLLVPSKCNEPRIRTSLQIIDVDHIVKYLLLEEKITVVEDQMVDGDNSDSLTIGQDQARVGALVEGGVEESGFLGFEVSETVELQLIVKHRAGLRSVPGYDAKVCLIIADINARCDVHINLLHAHQSGLRHFRFC